MTSISLRGVSKSYPPSVTAVDDVTLDIRDGEFLVLLGGADSGKSTLLKLLAGIEPPTRGEVLFDGQDAADMTAQERRVAMIFQNFALYPDMTVAANIGFPLRAAAVQQRQTSALVMATAQAVGVADLLQRMPVELTAEQQQRVALARAVVRSPRLFLLDDPVSDLAGRAGVRMLTEIVSTVRASGVTAVYATADRGDAPAEADRIGIMRRGRMEDIGPPRRVQARPATAFVAGFLGGPETALLEATVEAEDGSHTAVWLGDGVGLALPWSDLQARQLTHFHQDRVIVGIPPQALRLVGPAPNVIGHPVLPGIVRRTVHLGYHCVVAVDVGAVAVDIDGDHGRPGPPVDDPTSTPSPAISVVPRSSAAHAAEVTLRLGPSGAPHSGSRVHVHVDLARVHFFDTYGRRIGTGWR